MIKNAQLVKEAEMKLHRLSDLTMQQRLAIMSDMLLFARKFEKPIDCPENSPHVKMLVKLAKSFRSIRHNEIGNA